MHTSRIILIVLITIIFNTGCNEESDKPISPKASALKALSGKWVYVDCWLEYNYPDNNGGTGELYQNLQEEFTADYTFTFIYTLYYQSKTCSENAIAQVIQTGTYNLHSPYQSDVPDNPTNTIETWKMDITFENVEIKGNRLMALERISAVERSATYYDIVAIGSDVKYDSSMQNSLFNRPSVLNFTSIRINDFNNLVVEPNPVFSGAPSAAEYQGEWDLHCVDDGATASDPLKMYTEQYDMSILSGNIFKFKNSLWSGTDCKGTQIGSITMSGVFEIVEPTLTQESKVTATTFKFIFDPDSSVVIEGDPLEVANSMKYRGLSGNTYYRFMFTDPKYSLVYYGGWLETSVLNLPGEFEGHGHRY